MSFTYEYPRPAVTVDAIVTATENGKKLLLLIERNNEPYKGYWALPGGFVEMEEDLETACRRELMEETNIAIDGELTQFYTAGRPDRDPRGRTISVVYSATLNQKQNPEGGDDAAQARWFPVDDLPDLAFDHAEILKRFFTVCK